MVEIQVMMRKELLKQTIKQIRKRIHNLRNKMHSDQLKGLSIDPEDEIDLVTCETIREVFENNAFTKSQYKVPEEETSPGQLVNS